MKIYRPICSTVLAFVSFLCRKQTHLLGMQNTNKHIGNVNGSNSSIPEMFHAGAVIREELNRQGRRMSWFADQMCTERSNVYKVLKRQSIDTDFIVKASLLLNVDFFKKMSERLEESLLWKNHAEVSAFHGNVNENNQVLLSGKQKKSKIFL